MPIERKWTGAEIEAEAAAIDWSEIDKMIDEQIEAAAAADPDTCLATDAELERAVRERTERLRAVKKPAAE